MKNKLGSRELRFWLSGTGIYKPAALKGSEKSFFFVICAFLKLLSSKLSLSIVAHFTEFF